MEATQHKGEAAMKQDITTKPIQASLRPNSYTNEEGEKVIEIPLFKENEYGLHDTIGTAELTVDDALLLATNLINTVRNKLFI